MWLQLGGDVDVIRTQQQPRLVPKEAPCEFPGVDNKATVVRTGPRAGKCLC